MESKKKNNPKTQYLKACSSQAEEDNHRELTNTPVTINCLMLLAKVKANEQMGNKHPIS